MVNRHNLVTFLLFGYLLVVVIFMLVKNVSMTPDRLFIYLFFAAIVIGRGKTFVRDWVPFLALLLGYEMLRGFADNFFSVNVENLVVWEKALFFGYLPTQVLQNLFYTVGQIGVVDIVSTLLYFLHFPLPLAIAFFLWMRKRPQYYRFIIALLILSFSGFITFLLFPAAPPWYAANEGIISVTKITNLAVDHLGWSWNISYYYERLNPNPVAAMPSLHAAYPMLVLLVLGRYSKKAFWFFLPYPLLVWFSAVYLGEHYVIDIIAGIFYALAAFFLVYHWEKVRNWLFPKLTTVYHSIKQL